MASSEKELYGLIGYPLGHSFSQGYFNNKFASEGIDAEYLNFEIPSITDLAEIIATHPALRGLNVTIPYKQAVIPYLDEIDPTARKIGAVNVIRVSRNAAGHVHLKGFNSDIIGFTDSISPLLSGKNHTHALVLGTGGASHAVMAGLSQLGISGTLVSRSPRPGVITYADLDDVIMASHTVIVNTTPLGMYPLVDACPDIPYRLVAKNHVCFDLLYNPDVTMFMQRCAEQGATVKNGLEMLLLQAFASWEMWHRSI